MKKGSDILMLGLARGDDDFGSTAWSLAQAIAQEQTVYYIEPPQTWRDSLTRFNSPRYQLRRNARKKGRKHLLKAFDDQSPNLKVLVPPIMVPIQFLPPGKLYNHLLQLNRQRFNLWLQHQISLHNIKASAWINVFNPFYDPPLPGIQKVYYCTDRMEEAGYLRKHGPLLEQQVMRSSDLVLNTSKILLEHSQLSGARRAEVLRNAADYLLFAKAVSLTGPQPKAMQEKGAEVNLVYIGSIDSRIDTELVAQICRQRPNWQLWWIGPIKKDAVAPLLEVAQCHFLGSLPQRELGEWLRYADCGIIPFLCNAYTQAIYPLKVHEYLASGVGVVSTPFSQDMLHFPPHTLHAETADEWVLSIEKLIAQNQQDQKRIRSAFASQHSWQIRANEFFRLLPELAPTPIQDPKKKRLSA
ncbi:MAG: glycosyltransferase [Bacteroidota bacterium]